MHLTPTERDRLLLFTAAELARRRRAAGVRLNVPEATAIIADTICEAARAGARHAAAAQAGRSALRPADVLPEVPFVVRSVAVEAVFTDGSRLVVVQDPFGPPGSDVGMPGALIPAEPSPASATTPLRLTVENTAGVDISVTSHFHFFEANPRLRFDRAAAFGRHLDIAAGSHVRFGAGESSEVGLVPIAGDRVVIGFAGLVDGPLDAPEALAEALRRARACGYLDSRADSQADPEQAIAAAQGLWRNRNGGGDVR